jgi:hypothetical protein
VHRKKVEIFHFRTYQCQEKAQLHIFSPWEKVGIFYFLATSSRKKSNSQFFRLSYEHPPYLNDYAETAPFEANKHTSFYSLDTRYNWILGYWHFKAGNFGEC